MKDRTQQIAELCIALIKHQFNAEEYWNIETTDDYSLVIVTNKENAPYISGIQSLCTVAQAMRCCCQQHYNYGLERPEFIIYI